jgi:DNA-binding transcriptional LysR family regulator
VSCVLRIVGAGSAYVKCIYDMTPMRQAHEQAHAYPADLNLLGPLYALLDERHVTNAAVRCGLSQPAMSRALRRLRQTFGDELLVRTTGVYERTPRGERLLLELQDIMPRVERAIRGDRFDASTSRERFQIVTTEYAGAVVVPTLYERLASVAPHMRLTVLAWDDGSVATVEAGRADLAIAGLHRPPGLDSEELFVDEFVCLVAQSHPIGARRLTLERYLAYGHVTIAMRKGRQPWIDDVLAERGAERRVAMRTPFHLSAILATARSQLICTLSRRLAVQLAPIANLRIVRAPDEFARFVYGMAWHRRLRDDPAHAWLRAQVRAVSAAL